ncbi:MAG: cysteine hydrolase family protein [Kribbellaceae bacterium]
MTEQAPLLTVIDMQRIFGDPDSEWATPGFDKIVEPIATLVDAYAPRVLFTRFVAPEVPEGAWQDYYKAWPFALQPPDAPDYQLVDRFAGHPTLDAPTFSKWGDELAGQVGPGGTMVLTGVSTDCCVITTALAAVDAGVHVRVVADACAGVDDKTHQQALDIMSLYAPQLELTTVSDLLSSTVR